MYDPFTTSLRRSFNGEEGEGGRGGRIIIVKKRGIEETRSIRFEINLSRTETRSVPKRTISIIEQSLVLLDLEEGDLVYERSGVSFFSR